MTMPRPTAFFPSIADFAAGKDTPRAFLERCLARFAEFEPVIGAFVCHDLIAARAAADRSTDRWRNGQAISSIDGMPIGVKDTIETIDMPTQMGSPLFAGWRAGRDGASVAALREAGAVILGKTVTTEFGATAPRGTRNPWDMDRTPGGSSSGSAAAVACGMVPAALGTQVFASIVRPASFCGCVGFKPTAGGINRGGSHDYFSQSCTGVLAASLKDAWLVAINVATRAGGDPGYPGLDGPSEPPAPERPRMLAVLRTAGWTTAAPDAQRAFQAAVSRFGRCGITIADRHDTPAIDEVEEAISDAVRLSGAINDWEGRWPLNTYRNRNSGNLSRASLDRVARAEAMMPADYRVALARRQSVRTLYANLQANHDAIITLAASGAAPIGLESTGDPTFGVPGSLLGVPALSLPLLSAGGLPLGLQVMGFAGSDARLLGIARALSSVFASGPALPSESM